MRVELQKLIREYTVVVKCRKENLVVLFLTDADTFKSNLRHHRLELIPSSPSHRQARGIPAAGHNTHVYPSDS
jgi:hypothetical protein